MKVQSPRALEVQDINLEGVIIFQWSFDTKKLVLFVIFNITESKYASTMYINLT